MKGCGVSCKPSLLAILVYLVQVETKVRPILEPWSQPWESMALQNTCTPASRLVDTT